MEVKDAQFWMKQCVDSGLWNAGGAEGEEEEGAADGKEESERLQKEMDPID